MEDKKEICMLCGEIKERAEMYIWRETEEGIDYACENCKNDFSNLYIQ